MQIYAFSPLLTKYRFRNSPLIYVFHPSYSLFVPQEPSLSHFIAHLICLTLLCSCCTKQLRRLRLTTLTRCLVRQWPTGPNDYLKRQYASKQHIPVASEFASRRTALLQMTNTDIYARCSSFLFTPMAPRFCSVFIVCP